MEITIALNGHRYSAVLSRGPQDTRTGVSIYQDEIWTGNGWLAPQTARIIDCAADIGDEVYAALDAEIQLALSGGSGADVDPRP